MISLRLLCVPFLGLCAALPAQHDEKPKADTKTAETQAPAKDDAATAKDATIAAIDKFIASKNIDKKVPSWRQTLSEPPKQAFDANTDYFWHIETEVGALKIRFHSETAPQHVTSGIYLARLGFFDGVVFHRIIPGFMAQGGDPTGSGRGGPGYKFAGEFDGKRSHDKPGILSMANAGPGTDGSQFFITFGPTKMLDGRHTVWGEVVDGMPTLKALEAKGTQENNGMLAVGVKMTRTWVSAAPKAAAPATGEAKKDGEKKEEKKEGDKK